MRLLVDQDHLSIIEMSLKKGKDLLFFEGALLIGVDCDLG
jgi:hypothetical protein